MKKGGAVGMAKDEAAVGQVKAELEDVGKAAGRAVAVAAAPALSPLSETLWREKAAVELLGDVSARLAWRDLTVTVALGSGETQTVLEGLTGYAEPGTITALMGPSGSGKSTLLDSLAGRLAANAFLSGTVLLNGRKANLSFGAAFERRDDPLERTTTSEAIRRLFSYYQRSQYYFVAWQKVDEMARVKGTVLDAGGSQASFGMQTFTLTKRSFVNMSRDFGYYWLRLVIYIVVTICIGSIYLNVGTKYSSILARGACASFIFGFVTFMSIGGFPSFVEDMKVFQRERMNGHYGVLAFVISNTLLAMPFLILITFLSGTLCYFMVRLHPGFTHYLFFVLCLYASVTVVESLMMAIASIIPNFLMGIIIGAGIQGIFMLVSGYFRLPHDIPKPFWRYPMSYISFHYWALQGQYQNDLMGLVFDNQDDELIKIPGEYILKNVFQIDVSRSKWLDLSVLFSMIFIYRLLFFAMIKVSEDVTPWVRGYIARRRVQHKRREAELAVVRTPSLRSYVVDAAELPADHP